MTLPPTHRFWRVSGLTFEQKETAQRLIKGQSRITRTFLVMTALSTIIAAYGLLTNSTAVVIGAMLLAPLMGPIFGIALGLSIGDLRLFRQAFVAECLGVLLVVLIGYAIGTLPWRLEFGSEIVARTQPTLFDLIIALASGLAGAYAMLDEKVSASITGVAIATALVPPLTTCGLCLANGRYEWALGAFILFVANFLAIQLAGAIVFTLFGLQALRPETMHSLAHLLRRFGISIVLLLGVTLFMWQTLHRLVVNDRLIQQLNQVISRELNVTTGAMLNKVTFEHRDGVLEVMAVILTPQEFASESVALLEGTLRKEVDSTTHLIVRSLISKDADRQGQVFLPETVLARQQEVAQERTLLSQVSQELQRQFVEIPTARLTDLRRERGEDGDSYTAVVRTPVPIEPKQIARVQDSLRVKISPKLRLIIRSVLTRDADAQQYLYQPNNTATVLSKTEIRQRQWLEGALRNQLRVQVPEAELQEFRYAYRDGWLKMFAIVRSPETVSSTQVRTIQGMLRWYVDPTALLVIRSIVGADAGAEGYIRSLDEGQF